MRVCFFVFVVCLQTLGVLFCLFKTDKYLYLLSGHFSVINRAKPARDIMILGKMM